MHAATDMGWVTIWLPAWLMVLARMSGVVIALPLLAGFEVPAQVRIFLAVALAVMAFPIALPLLPQGLSIGQTAAGLVGEIVVGELLGLAAAVVLQGAMMGGHLVAQQSGLALGTIINPLFDGEASPIEQLCYFAAGGLFLALRGHVAVVQAVLDSIRIVPPGTVAANASIVDYVIGVATSMCDLAMRIAGPAMLALLLSTVAMGFVSKTMPQLNILSVGFTLKLVIAMAVMAGVVGLMEEPIASVLNESMDAFRRLLPGIRTVR